MNTTLLTAGIVLVAAAIVGGGLKMLGAEVPMLTNKIRQVLLAVFGIILIVASKFVGTTDTQQGIVPPKPQPIDTIAVPPKPASVTSLSLKCINAPQYVAPGSEAVVQVNITDQDGTSQPNTSIILSSAAGTVLKNNNTDAGNGNVMTGYTDAEGNFFVRFVYPSVKPSLSYALQIEASVNKLTATGSVVIYSQTFAAVNRISYRNVSLSQMKLKPVATRLTVRK